MPKKTIAFTNEPTGDRVSQLLAKIDQEYNELYDVFYNKAKNTREKFPELTSIMYENLNEIKHALTQFDDFLGFVAKHHMPAKIISFLKNRFFERPDIAEISPLILIIDEDNADN